MEQTCILILSYLCEMTSAEIRRRFDQVTALRQRFTEVQLFVRGLLEKHGCATLDQLPDEWQAVIAERAAGLKTPGELSVELTTLNREVDSLTVVRELHKLYGLPDTRIG
jgi:hypothetical protein